MGERTTASRNGYWETLPADDGYQPWSIDPDAGLVQGPLEMDFFSDKGLRLSLGHGQIALLVEDSDLSAVYLEGSHSLRVGRDTDCIRPEAELLFLDTVRTFSITWDQSQSVWIPDEGGRMVKLPISGGCSCRIADAARFYSAFLRGGDGDAVDFALQVIDCVVRTRIEEKLAEHLDDSDADPAALQTFIDGLAPADMNHGLDRLGLVCESLAVHLPRTPATHLASGQSADLQLQQH